MVLRKRVKRIDNDRKAPGSARRVTRCAAAGGALTLREQVRADIDIDPLCMVRS
jgi:hypothetical protein